MHAAAPGRPEQGVPLTEGWPPYAADGVRSMHAAAPGRPEQGVPLTEGWPPYAADGVRA